MICIGERCYRPAILECRGCDACLAFSTYRCVGCASEHVPLGQAFLFRDLEDVPVIIIGKVVRLWEEQ